MIGPPPRRTDADPHTGPRRIGDGMSRYRISKYDPWSRDERGYFTGEDWTSFSDIGKEYHGTVLTDLQYAAVEAKYINAVTTVLRQNQVHTMIVGKLEKRSSPAALKEMLSRCHLPFPPSDAAFVSRIKDGARLDMTEIEETVRLVLRDCFWCELSSEGGAVRVEFGYDYYVYLQGVTIDADTIASFRSEGIYIESPQSLRGL